MRKKRERVTVGFEGLLKNKTNQPLTVRVSIETEHAEARPDQSIEPVDKLQIRSKELRLVTQFGSLS